MVVALFYLAVWPLGETPNATNFFATYLTVIAFVVLYLGAKIYYRGRRWVDLRTIDLDKDMRLYPTSSIVEGDGEAGSPARKRFDFLKKL